MEIIRANGLANNDYIHHWIWMRFLGEIHVNYDW